MMSDGSVSHYNLEERLFPCASFIVRGALGTLA
jgi:hypothetical protein